MLKRQVLDPAGSGVEQEASEVKQDSFPFI